MREDKNKNSKKLTPFILRNTVEMEYKIYGLLSSSRNMKNYSDRDISDLCRFFINLENYTNNKGKFPQKLKDEAAKRNIDFKNLLN